MLLDKARAACQPSQRELRDHVFSWKHTQRRPSTRLRRPSHFILRVSAQDLQRLFRCSLGCSCFFKTDQAISRGCQQWRKFAFTGLSVQVNVLKELPSKVRTLGALRRLVESSGSGRVIACEVSAQPVTECISALPCQSVRQRPTTCSPLFLLLRFLPLCSHSWQSSEIRRSSSFNTNQWDSIDKV